MTKIKLMHFKSKLPKSIYAFIDSQNLNLGVRSQGWKLDYCVNIMRILSG